MGRADLYLRCDPEQLYSRVAGSGVVYLHPHRVGAGHVIGYWPVGVESPETGGGPVGARRQARSIEAAL